MAKFIGRLVDIGLARETTRGTVQASATYHLPKTSLSIDDAIEQVVDESSVGVIEDSPNAVMVARFAEGEIEGNIYDRSFGSLLHGALGAVATTGPAETTVYTHTFTAAQNAQHPVFTLFQNDPNGDFRYAMAAISSLELDIALGQYAKYTAGFRSRVGATHTYTPSYTAENHFLPQHGSIRIATNLAGLGAASDLNIRMVRLAINKNLEDDRRIGSLDQVDILNKQLSVEGSLELVFDDNTFKTEMLADAARAMRIRLTNTDVIIGTTLNPQLTIDLARVKFSKFERKYDNNGITTAAVDFKAFYSLADTSMISAVLRNTAVSY